MPGSDSESLDGERRGPDHQRTTAVRQPHAQYIERARRTTARTKRLLEESRKLMEQARALMDE